MRIGVLIVVAALCAGCGGSGERLFRQYEYEEDLYLDLDGSATLYVNSSVPALNALRGTTFDTRPNARVDRADVREYFTSDVTRVTRVSLTRRNNRRYVHLRIAVDDVRRLGSIAPFAWSSYRLAERDEIVEYRQAVGAPAEGDAGPVRWTGQELAAFRLHLPSRIVYHNAGEGNLRRGNILVWEQTFSERLRGEPLVLEARMETQSILYTTLFLFGATFVAVAAMFGGVLWWLMRPGRGAVDAADGARRTG